MTSRNIAIIAVVVVIAVAACAALMLSGDGGNDSSDDNTIDYLTPDSGKAKISSVDTKLLVFGNANNDVYLDEKDVQFIQDIVDGKTKWNKEKNPFADTNADGKITAEDVVLLKRFIDRQDATMFYVNSNLDTVSVKWPLAGNIMIGGVNDADILKIIGKVDSVVAVCGTHDPKDFDKTVYPEAVNWKYAGSYPYDYETVVSMEGSILMGQNFMYTEEFDKKVSDGYDKIRIDSVKLHEARFMNNVDGVACTITLGALMDCFDYPTYKQYRISCVDTTNERLSFFNRWNTVLISRLARCDAPVPPRPSDPLDQPVRLHPPYRPGCDVPVHPKLLRHGGYRHLGIPIDHLEDHPLEVQQPFPLTESDGQGHPVRTIAFCEIKPPTSMKLEAWFQRDTMIISIVSRDETISGIQSQHPGL